MISDIKFMSHIHFNLLLEVVLMAELIKLIYTGYVAVVDRSEPGNGINMLFPKRN